jgi:hypothetical protein
VPDTQQGRRMRSISDLRTGSLVCDGSCDEPRLCYTLFKRSPLVLLVYFATPILPTSRPFFMPARPLHAAIQAVFWTSLSVKSRDNRKIYRLYCVSAVFLIIDAGIMQLLGLLRALSALCCFGVYKMQDLTPLLLLFIDSTAFDFLDYSALHAHREPCT